MKIYHVSNDPEGAEFLYLEFSKLFLDREKANAHADERNREIQEEHNASCADAIERWENIKLAVVVLTEKGIDPDSVFAPYQLREPHFYGPVDIYSVHELEVEE